MRQSQKFIAPIFFAPFALFILLAASRVGAQTPPVLAEGFPILFESRYTFGSFEGPVAADLDRDGRLDIIFSNAKKVHAFHADGKPLAGWPQTTQESAMNSPAVGDLDHDGFLEVVTFDRSSVARGSLLYVWNHQGRLLPGFPLALGHGSFAITLYDLDGDRDLEIIGSFNYKQYAFHHDGAMVTGWPFDPGAYAISSKAAVGDVDGDGTPEIVASAELMVSNDLPKNARGRLYVWSANGNLLPNWPITTPPGHTFTGWSNPALVDVNQDGFLEIAVGTYSFVRPNQHSFVALYRYDAALMPGWPQSALGVGDSLNPIASGPAVADLNSDGKPDLIFGDIWDHVVAWQADGSLVPGWPVVYGKVDSNLAFRSLQVANPSVGDVDGDGHLEVLSGVNQADIVDGIWRGRIYAFNHDAASLTWSPLRPRQFASFNAVAMADLENDGTLDLITVSEDTRDNESWLTVWEIPGVPYVEERFPWPMFGHDRWHTSQYGFKPPDEPTVSVKEREERSQFPQAFVLHQNYPNPFYAATQRGSRNRTEISYELPMSSHVELRLFNLLGEEVRRLIEGEQTPGEHKVLWNGRDEKGDDLPAGIYFYRMEATPQNRGGEKFSAIKKLMVVK